MEYRENRLLITFFLVFGLFFIALAVLEPRGSIVGKAAALIFGIGLLLAHLSLSKKKITISGTLITAIPSKGNVKTLDLKKAQMMELKRGWIGENPIYWLTLSDDRGSKLIFRLTYFNEKDLLKKIITINPNIKRNEYLDKYLSRLDLSVLDTKITFDSHSKIKKRR